MDRVRRLLLVAAITGVALIPLFSTPSGLDPWTAEQMNRHDACSRSGLISVMLRPGQSIRGIAKALGASTFDYGIAGPPYDEADRMAGIDRWWDIPVPVGTEAISLQRAVAMNIEQGQIAEADLPDCGTISPA